MLFADYDLLHSDPKKAQASAGASKRARAEAVLRQLREGGRG